MSTTNQGGPPAIDQAEQHLTNHSGWHEVSTIANAIGYSHGHTLGVCKELDQDPNSDVEGRKNPNKPVMGYYVNGDLEIPGDDRQEVIDLIKQHGTARPNFSQMSLDDLYNHLRYNVASGSTRLDSKWEFRVP